MASNGGGTITGSNMFGTADRKSPYELRKARMESGRYKARVGQTLSKRITERFPSSFTKINEGGWLRDAARPLAAKGGKNAFLDWKRVGYVKDGDSWTKRVTRTPNKWGIATSRRTNKLGDVLNGREGWIRQLQIVRYQLTRSAENFRVVAGQRALKVFQMSFARKQFYSSNAPKWPKMTDWTKQKRARRGTGSELMREDRDLYNSMIFDERLKEVRTERIVKEKWNLHNTGKTMYKGQYAYFHNEGDGHYGKSGIPYKRRQFIGHSSHLNPMLDPFMSRLVKLYLFDSVWLIKGK